MIKNLISKGKHIQRNFAFSTTHVVHGHKVRQQLAKSIDRMESCVRVTLGPLGKNVALDYEAGNPKITKDGVTVAKSIFFKDRMDEMGANLLRRVSHSTNLYAGDGTTTSTILAKEIINEGIKLVETGLNPIGVKDGIIKAKKLVLEYLEAIKQPVETKEDMYNVARVSVNYDDFLAKILSEAVFETGKNGIIHIEPNYSYDTTLLFTEGVTLTRGYASEEFIKDKSKIKIETDNPYVLVVNQELDSVRQILPILDKIKATKRPLFIAAKDISSSVLSTLLYNHQRDIIEINAITVPGQGELSRELLTDLSVISGARFFDESDYQQLIDCDISELGTAKKIITSPTESFFIGSGGRAKEMEARMDKIRKQMDSKEASSASRMTLMERLARLNGKMAVLLCGGSSEAEIGETRDKIVDALNSIKTAKEHGVLPGGGAALLHASRVLDMYEGATEEERAGVEILKAAIRKPLKRLIHNADVNGNYVVEKILQDYPDNVTGYDLRTGEFCNMMEKGVVDSFQVVSMALEDACSVGGMILTTEAAVVRDKIYIAPSLKTYKRDPF